MATVASVLVGVASIFYHTTPGTAVGSVTTQFGFTEDGVTITYTPTVVDIDVEEETFSIARVLEKEEFMIALNIAENTQLLYEVGMAGALTGGAGVVDLGGGAINTMALKITGTAPGATTRTIYVPYANPTGTVGSSYRKGEKTIIPLEFKAYQGVAGGDVVTITDA